MTNDFDYLLLGYDAFLRSVQVNIGSPFALFLGAGASISSGIPSAYDCIWHWKKEIFLTNNPDKKDRFSDISIYWVKETIQEWLDNQNDYPKKDAPEEYSYYIEKAFPINSDRNRFFQQYISKAKLTTGYKLLPLLGEANIIKQVWTTNFDNLIEKASVGSNLNPIKIDLTNLDRLNRMPQVNETLLISLHGDYRYDSLKNTLDELKDLEKKAKEKLIEHLKNHHLIISGYSGRDDSVMSALEEAYSAEGQGRLYWCGYVDEEPSLRIKRLILKARENNREAHFIQTKGFDDLFYGLASFCLKDEIKNKADSIINEYRESKKKALTPFAINISGATSLIKSNKFYIEEFPKEAYQFEAPEIFVENKAWQNLNALLKDNLNIVAVPQRRKIIALGTLNSINNVFGSKINGEIQRTPIENSEIERDGSINKLFRQAITRSTANLKNLNTDGDSLIWLKEAELTKKIGNENYFVYDAALLKLSIFNEIVYLVIKPTIYATNNSGLKASQSIEKELKREILSKQFNNKFNEKIKMWTNLIFELNGKSKPLEFNFPQDMASDFKFKIKGIPSIAEINEKGKYKLDDKYSKPYNYKGLVIDEPLLLFNNNNNGLSSHFHPLKGLISYLPYDYGVNPRSINIGVICPKSHSQKVYSFLSSFNSKYIVDYKRDYLVDFPGFTELFKINLNIPNIQDDLWINFPEVDLNMGTEEGAKVIREEMIKSIDQLIIGNRPDLVLTFIPQYMEKWESYYNDNEKFDLHDFIKAYCVKKNLPSQFLREKTVNDKLKCSIMWWLSLSFYFKTNHLPWLLEGLDDDTAYIGIGYSIDKARKKGNQIILGCSHIYNSKGYDIGYHLGKIEDPIIIQRNPFMSKEDANTIALNSLYLYHKTMNKYPKRVVIHKRTRFIDKEKEGFLSALKGVDNIDMLEINIEDSIRFISSFFDRKQNSFAAANFPIRRGTFILLDSNKALLWNHGNVVNENNRSYYLGGYRIPAPLIIRRHYGNSDIQTICKEILGLSKMNWNNFDLYSKIPATIESSSRIARIGNLLDRRGNLYNYRLFI